MTLEAPDREELDVLADLWVDLAQGQRAYDSHVRSEANRAAVREALARSLVAGGLLVARDAGELVGFVMFGPETGSYDQDVRRGVIDNLYVVPDRRGEGVGSDLLSAAESRLREEGVDAITLEVMATNERARRFYRRHGYESHRVELEKQSDTHSNP